MCVFGLADDPGAADAGLALPPAPAGLPGWSARLEEAMRLLLPAAAAGDHDREPGPDRLDHQGDEPLPGEFTNGLAGQVGVQGWG